MQPAIAAGGPKRCLAGMDLAGGIELPLSCVQRSASAAVSVLAANHKRVQDCVPLEAKPEIAGNARRPSIAPSWRLGCPCSICAWDGMRASWAGG